MPTTTKSVEKAYNYVRQRTLHGIYGSGIRITEQEIADATGVSRTPVREALRRLGPSAVHRRSFVVMEIAQPGLFDPPAGG